MMAWVKGTPERRVVKRAYPDAEVVEAKDLTDPDQVLQKWIKETSLRQVRATAMMVYVLTDSGEEEEIAVFLDMLWEALLAVQWQLRITVACESWKAPEVPEGRSNPWAEFSAACVSPVEQNRWYAISHAWLAPWDHSSLRWFRLRKPVDVSQEARVLDQRQLDRGSRPVVLSEEAKIGPLWLVRTLLPHKHQDELRLRASPWSGSPMSTGNDGWQKAGGSARGRVARTAA